MMKRTYYVMKRELKSYFISPIAYSVFTIFAIISGFFFYTILMHYTKLSMQAIRFQQYQQFTMNLNQQVFVPLFHNIAVVMLLMMPLITMRLFSEEKKSGTIELVLTYPVKDGEVVMGKFMAAGLVFLVMLSINLIQPIIVESYSELEILPLASGYLGLILLGLAFISLGMFLSTLTENQIVAALLSFGALLLFWIIGWTKIIAEGSIGELLSNLSLMEHIDSFTKGVIQINDLIYYLSFIVFFLFLTLRSLETKKWRG